jgi:hypothetical protein
MWHDPPWVREGRAPSLDELIPRTDREVDRHVDDVRRAMAAHLDGRTFAGLGVRLDLTDPHSVSVHRDSLVVRLDILDRDAGVVVGSTVRSFGRDHDGSLYVEHVSLRLTDQAQGGGFAREWNRFLEGWYRESGVSHIEVHASSTIGGYAWARAGYDWAPNTEHRANSLLRRLALQMRQIDGHIADVGRWAAGDGDVDIAALQRRYGAEHPDELMARMREEYAAGQDILDRARRYPFGSAGYPTPGDISHAGWDGRTGRDATWIGKEALLGSDWKGVKPISDTGPLHPRPRDPEITASAVPESAFHGFGRDAPAPDAVASLGRTALADRIAALPPESPLRGVHIGFSVVDAYALPDGAVARSVPVEGGYRIELSDRAADATVARAVAHEVAELSAIRAREAGGLEASFPDALRPGPLAEGATLSPHDMGRLAEVDALAHMLADPARAPNARAELTALRDHLGLRPDDSGAAARRELVDPYLRRAGHDPATIWADEGSDAGPGVNPQEPGHPADRAAAVNAVAEQLGLADPRAQEAIGRAYDVTYRHSAPFIVSVAADMLDALKAQSSRDPNRVVAFVGRDGHSFGLAIRELDADFHHRHCTNVVLSRAAVETALQDLEINAGRRFPELHDFRQAASKVDAAAIAGARQRLTAYLHQQGVPVGRPGSAVTLVDSSYKGTVQELLQAVYPDTRFDGMYMAFAASPQDPHPGTKQGFALHLDDPAHSFGGRPVNEMPEEPWLIMAHQDAIGSIEETLHGPASSPKRIDEGGPVQSPQRFESDPTAGLNPIRVADAYRDPVVREGVKDVNLIAVRDYARHIGHLRAAGGDWRGELSQGRDSYQAQLRAWIGGRPLDPTFGEVMDSFVRRSDKRLVADLAANVERLQLDAGDARAVWQEYDRLASLDERRRFVAEFKQHSSGRG